MAGPGGSDSQRKAASQGQGARRLTNWPRFDLRAILGFCEDIIHYAVAILLLALAFLVLVHTARLMVEGGTTFSVQVIDGINGVLFVIIVAELIQTVMAHFEHSGFQLKPFLIIGIISAIRHILTIGARLTLGGDLAGDVFRRSQIELGVETGVVLGLAVGLLLVRIVDDKGMNEFEGD